MLDHLAGVKCAFVWGNNDWDRAELQRYGEAIAVPCYGEFADLELDGKKVGLLHGDYPSQINALVKAQSHDYLLHGHTHVKRDERIGKTRIINPGALHRAAVKTVAILDTTEDRVEFIRVG
jgi:predicted phosphodiesterase